MPSLKKISDRLNLANSINWLKTGESLAKPQCQTCGLTDATGFDFEERIVTTVCARGHKSVWTVTLQHMKMMRRIYKLMKTSGHLEY